MPAQPIPVFWQLASDDQFRNIERFGTVNAAPEDAHSVHVEVHGLSAYGLYWYRFHAAGHVSPVGCTRTLPGLDSRVEALRFAFASESGQQVGRSPVYGQMARDDLDFVLFAGNYANQVRSDDGCASSKVHDLLAHYRVRFARCRVDPDLQAAHRALPWITVLDAPKRVPWASTPTVCGVHAGELAALHRAAARRAYREHIPVRRGREDVRLGRGARRLSLGPLTTLQVSELARLVERDPRFRQLADCYVRCELDRESFRADFLMASTTYGTNAPLEERATLLVHTSEARRVVVTTDVSTSDDEDRRRL